MSSIHREIEYYEHKLRYARSYSEERDIRDCLDRLYENVRYYNEPPRYVSLGSVTCLGIDLAKPEKTMEPKVNENAAIAVLETKLAEHKKNVTSMAPYVTSSETSQKTIKQIEAALKKLG